MNVERENIEILNTRDVSGLDIEVERSSREEGD
mgnify:CR=1 FL=1